MPKGKKGPLHFPLSRIRLQRWKSCGPIDRGFANEGVGRLGREQPGCAGGLGSK